MWYVPPVLCYFIKYHVLFPLGNKAIMLVGQCPTTFKKIVPKYANGLFYHYGGLWWIFGWNLAYEFKNFITIK